jgi:hypothetical protein
MCNAERRPSTRGAAVQVPRRRFFCQDHLHVVGLPLFPSLSSLLFPSCCPPHPFFYFLSLSLFFLPRVLAPHFHPRGIVLKFRESGQVGDAAIDLPDASVIIQVPAMLPCACMPAHILCALCHAVDHLHQPFSHFVEAFLSPSSLLHNLSSAAGLERARVTSLRTQTCTQRLSPPQYHLLARARAHTHTFRYHRISGRDRRRRSD